MADRRIDGIQWLRAIMSVFVVAWHLGGGGTSLIWSDQFRQHVFTLSDFVNFHILLLAVPTFMLISDYLFAKSNPDAATAWRRASRVVVLLLFWPLLFTIYTGGWTSVISTFPSSAKGALVYLLTGGQSIYYFFVSVLITYGLAFLANRLLTTLNLVLLVVASLTTAAAPLVSALLDWPLLSAYWSPFNFIAFPFAAIVILRLLDRDAPASRMGLAVLALLAIGTALAVLEWRLYPHAVLFPGQGYAFPAYTRASLVAFGMAIMILAVRWNPGLPTVVDFMARYSLALYLLHLFVADPMRRVVEALAATPLAAWMSPLGQTWLLIALTIAVSYLAAKLLSLVWKDRLLF